MSHLQHNPVFHQKISFESIKTDIITFFQLVVTFSRPQSRYHHIVIDAAQPNAYLHLDLKTLIKFFFDQNSYTNKDPVMYSVDRNVSSYLNLTKEKPTSDNGYLVLFENIPLVLHPLKLFPDRYQLPCRILFKDLGKATIHMMTVCKHELCKILLKKKTTRNVKIRSLGHWSV